MAEQKLELIVDIDETGAITGIKKIESATTKAGNEGAAAGKKMDSAWTSVKTTMVAAAAVIGGAVVKAFSDLTKGGVEFLDLQDDFENVFKGLAGSATEARDRLVTSFGLSTEAATKMLASVGILTQNMGFSTRASLQFSESIVGLADAWEKYNPKGMKAEEITNAMTMALSGNFRGLKQLGIVLDDAAVKQTALEQGIIGVNQEMSQQQKAQAILAAITERSTEALKGQNIENASLADKAKRAASAFDDIKKGVGIELTNALSGTIGSISEIGVSIDKVRRIAAPLISIMKALGQTMILSVTLPSSIIVNMVKGVVTTVMEMSHAIDKIKEGKIKEAVSGLAKTVGTGFKETLMAPINVLKSAGKDYIDAFDKIVHPIEIKRKENDKKAEEENDEHNRKLGESDEAAGKEAERLLKQRIEDQKKMKEAGYGSELEAELGHQNDLYNAAIESAQRLGADVAPIMDANERKVEEIRKKYSDKEDEDRKKTLAKRTENFKAIIEIAQAMMGIMTSISDAIFKNEIANIDATIEARNREFDEAEELRQKAFDAWAEEQYERQDITNSARDALAKMDEEDRQKKLEAMAEERDAAIANGDEELAAEIQRDIDRMTLEKEAADRDKQIALEKKALDESIAEAKRISDEKAAAAKLALDRQNAEEKYKIELAQWRVNKAMRIADAVMGTASAIIAALGNPVPFAGPILAALAGAAGAVQTGIIIAEQPPPPPKFAMGGTLGGGSAYGDRTAFMGNRGETILNTNQGQNLFNALDRAGLLSQNQNSNVMNNSTTNNNQNMGRTVNIFGPVTMSADGEFQSSVDRRLRAGGTFT